ncbi:hypothetical protein HDK77DRAFT_55375 [Phyllosticta capitalensis]|uniref:Cut9 interacting protein Scn1 n=1 Tax=Phyllosticta capitalensis TaxID=121624 RepID=A0ABR1Y9U6_9PEZI
MTAASPAPSFPWHIGVFDAHCHPTDTMSSIAAIPDMKARALTVMATRAQDQQLVASVARDLGIKSTRVDSWDSRERIVPCFGWHPWFAHQMFDEAQYGGKQILDDDAKVSHYKQVLSPAPDDVSFLLSLPNPIPFSEFLEQTRRHLERFPLALVGEIGLDKSFRIPQPALPEHHETRDSSLTPGGREGRRLSPHCVSLEHQKHILTAQLNLAGQLRRAVSVHGVQAHGVLFETLRATWKGHERKSMSKRERKKRGISAEEAAEEQNGDSDAPRPYPPRICLHSYSGHPSSLSQYFDASVPADVYVSFSTAINYSDRAASTTSQSIKVVPDDRVLVESDLHIAGEDMDKYLEDVVRRICEIKEWSLEDGVRRLRNNWERFAFGRQSR